MLFVCEELKQQHDRSGPEERSNPVPSAGEGGQQDTGEGAEERLGFKYMTLEFP